MNLCSNLFLEYLVKRSEAWRRGCLTTQALRTPKLESFRKKTKKRTKFITSLKIGIWTLLVATCLSVTGCSVTPKVHDRETIAYEGNSETAGILAFNDDGSLKITEEARSRYNSYIARFGRDSVTPLTKDFGITKLPDGNYSLTLEGAECWAALKRIEKRQRIDNSK